LSKPPAATASAAHRWLPTASQVGATLVLGTDAIVALPLAVPLIESLLPEKVFRALLPKPPAATASAAHRWLPTASQVVATLVLGTDAIVALSLAVPLIESLLPEKVFRALLHRAQDAVHAPRRAPRDQLGARGSRWATKLMHATYLLIGLLLLFLLLLFLR
jgi:hypothetical protein